jgi:hypothetical protein
MTMLIERLKRFNRKERFLLVGLALDNPSLTLGANFRSSLGDLFNLAVPSKEEDVFVRWTTTSNGSTLHSAVPR